MGILAHKTIFFGVGAAGEFWTWRWPKRDGIYKYMPYRSAAHYEMCKTIRAGQPAHCHYERDGHTVRFTATAIPKYARLQCSHFEFEKTG